MAKILRISLIFMGLAISHPARADNLDFQDDFEIKSELQHVIDQFEESYHFPGATVSAALPNGQIISVATGLADKERNIEMTPDSRMLAASIGKMFVGTVILSLEDRGLLSQSDLVSHHLGEFDWFDQLPNAATMTISHLLRHQSGLPDHPHMPSFQAAMAEDIAAGNKAMSPNEVIAHIVDQAPLNEAGQGWAYSDSGYILLGLIIEHVTGQSYYDYLTDNILTPLGMTNIAPSNRRDLSGLAAGYTSARNPFGLPAKTMDQNGYLIWDPSVEWTGGGLVATSHDLALWGHLVFNGKALGSDYLTRFLDGVAISSEMPDILYGTGVAIYQDTPNGPVYGHGGWIPGYVSSLRHYANHNVTIAFQINSDIAVEYDETDLVPALEKQLADIFIIR